MASDSVLAAMLEKMRVKVDDDDRTVLSKKLSYVLRHGARQLELEITEGGFVSVRALLAVGSLFAGVSIEALINFVEQSNLEKTRYELLEQPAVGDWLIRATNKHTMQGLEKPSSAAIKDKDKDRRDRGGGGGGDRRRVPAGGSQGQGAPAAPAPPSFSGSTAAAAGERQISEEEFCGRWRLDRLARARLAELPKATRQVAMQRFRPGAEVPPCDFPKVFVAYCKRFRSDPRLGGASAGGSQDSPRGSGGQPGGKGTHGGLGKEDDREYAEDLRLPQPRSPPMPAGFGGQRPGLAVSRRRPDWEEDVEMTIGMDAIAYEQVTQGGRAHTPDEFPAYRSPGSSPRSHEGHFDRHSPGAAGQGGVPRPQPGLLLGTSPTHHHGAAAIMPTLGQRPGGGDAASSPARRSMGQAGPSAALGRGPAGQHPGGPVSLAPAPPAPPPPSYPAHGSAGLISGLLAQVRLPRGGPPPPPPLHAPKVPGLCAPDQLGGPTAQGPCSPYARNHGGGNAGACSPYGADHGGGTGSCSPYGRSPVGGGGGGGYPSQSTSNWAQVPSPYPEPNLSPQHYSGNNWGHNHGQADHGYNQWSGQRFTGAVDSRQSGASGEAATRAGAPGGHWAHAPGTWMPAGTTAC